MILITAAGGKTGKAVVRALSGAASVSAFVHRDEQGAVLKSLGAEKIIVGDLHDELAIRSAMHGVRTVYHMCPNINPDETYIGRLVIAAAQKADVEHFVYHSVLHPQTERMAHHSAKLRVEEMIIESALPFTILQPAPYMQNLLAGWRSIVEEGVLHIPYSVSSKFSFTDLEDVAQAARIVMTESSHTNAIYELAGTFPTSHVEVAGILGRGLNRVVVAEKEELKDWRRGAKGMSEYTLENLVRMFEYYDHWGLVGNVNVLKWLLEREPTSLEMFIRRTISETSARS